MSGGAISIGIERQSRDGRESKARKEVSAGFRWGGLSPYHAYSRNPENGAYNGKTAEKVYDSWKKSSAEPQTQKKKPTKQQSGHELNCLTNNAQLLFLKKK